MSRGKDRKPHIGIYGKRNNGKSSLINCLSEQETAIVSDIAGTTTDPVKKSIEIFGIGPVVLVDTAGIDDSGDLGKKRIKKTVQTIPNIDLAILLLVNNEFGTDENELISRFKKKEVPYVIIHNKSDDTPLDSEFSQRIKSGLSHDIIEFSCLKPTNLESVISAMKYSIPESAYIYKSMIGGLVKANDVVLLVTPIDSEAPEGRMILPQVQLIRDVLDNDAVCIVLKESELESYIKVMQPKPV
ncbi:MAG: GTP-binding protein, partial [Bacteroidales bacterium]|nr:GTP-binding protein [Bacteroidales bacterium]